MMSRDITLTNPSGLHARPAALLVALAKSFTSNVTVRYKEKTANAKSILSILSLGASQGAPLTVMAEGADESAAIDQISAAFSNNLGEI